MDKGKAVISTLKELETKREPLVPAWQSCFDLTVPERGNGFYYSGVSNAVDTSKRAELFDSTGADSVQLFASALMSGLTPSNSKWFNLTLTNVKTDLLSGASRSWLQSSADVMFNRIHQSNYDAVALEFLKDIAIAGMSGLYIELDEEGKLTFEQWPLYNLFVQESKRNSGIDTVYRRLSLTPMQAHNLFGDNIPESTKELIETQTKLSETDEYVHCIRPRQGMKKTADAQLVANMPFESVYVHAKSCTVVKEGGFNEFPVVIPRWAVVPDTPYATGPFSNALADMKSLNELAKQYLTNAELVISPPLVADDDGVINPNNIKFGPREIIFKSTSGSIKPLFTVGDLSWAFNGIQALQSSIRKQMLADQIAPVAKQYMTAQEIMQRQDTIRGLLGPLFGRLESEYLRPLLQRVFGLLYRSGQFDEVPEELVNIEFTPSFTGPHARAQRMERANVIMNYAQNLASMAQIDPSVLDTFNFEKAATRYAELTGVEADLLFSEREIEAKREQRAQQQQAQMMAQQQPPLQ